MKENIQEGEIEKKQRKECNRYIYIFRLALLGCEQCKAVILQDCRITSFNVNNLMTMHVSLHLRENEEETLKINYRRQNTPIHSFLQERICSYEVLPGSARAS
jgi:hypothetical protein